MGSVGRMARASSTLVEDDKRGQSSGRSVRGPRSSMRSDQKNKVLDNTSTDISAFISSRSGFWRDGLWKRRKIAGDVGHRLNLEARQAECESG